MSFMELLINIQQTSAVIALLMWLYIANVKADEAKFPVQATVMGLFVSSSIAFVIITLIRIWQ